MKIKYLLLPIIALLFACSWLGQPDPEPTRVMGWRPAGLEFPESHNTGGAQRMIAVDEHILVMDAYLPPWEKGDTLEPRYAWRLWQGKVGSMDWKQVSLPNGDVPNTMLPYDGKAIIGTKYSGRIYSYDPLSETFEKVILPEHYYGVDSFQTVHSLGSYRGYLLVGLIRKEGVDQLFLWMNGLEGIRIPGVSKSGKWPFDRMVELGEYLYGIQNQLGVFRWKPGMDSLEKLPSPRGRTKATEDEFVSVITVHEGRIVVGYSDYQDGIYRLEHNDTWTNLTPLNSDSTLREAPRDVRVLLSYRGRLFAAGVQGSSLLVHAPRDPNCPDFGDWKIVSNGACYGQEGCWVGVSSQSWGAVGIGDTLYQSWWQYVIKMPFSEVDSMSHPFYRDSVMNAHESKCP